MSHNIETYQEREQRLSKLNVGVKGGTILTIRDDGGKEFGVYFCEQGEPGVVLNAWGKDFKGHSAVRIEREDLFALRELLAELPEEAFVRPADPVAPPAESYVVKDTAGDWWAFNDAERWEPVNMGGIHYPMDHTANYRRTFQEFPDEQIDKGLSRWTDGDVVGYESGDRVITYTRLNGRWDRVIGTDVGKGDSTDAMVDLMVTESPSYKVYRQQSEA